MAALETIRQKFGIGATIIIAFGLLLFLVNPADIIQTIQNASSKYDVGKIGSKGISYMDFDQEVKQLGTVSEMMTGQSASSEQGQQQLREATWRSLVDENLFIPNAQAAGIRVGHDEIVALMNGENVSPVLASNPIFQEDGAFSQERLMDFLQNMESDDSGRYTAIWDYLQKTVKTVQYYNKYNALFTSSAYTNALQSERAIADNNTSADVRFVMTPLGYAKDTTIVVSDSEIKAYYNGHKDQYKQQATRDIEYAVFEVVPSEADIAAQNEDFVKHYEEFATTDNLRSFLQKHGDNKHNLDLNHWYKTGELSSVNKDVEAFVAANATGTSPVFQNKETFYAARILGTRQLPDSVYIRHMMFVGQDGKHLADSLLPLVNKNNFSTLAAQYSDDKGSQDEGQLGNIGWVSQSMLSYLPTGFESVITAPLGKPYIQKSNIGYHILEVTKATKPLAKKQVAVYVKESLASKETYNKFYNQANVLAVRSAGKLENYKAACDSVGIYSHVMTINEGTANYGAINHAKEVTRWAFDNKPGKVSSIITVDNNYFFVVAVKEAHKEGYAKVSEVAEGIRNQLYQEKFAVKRQAEVAAEIEGLQTLDAVAEKLGTTVSTQEDVTFASMSRQLDPKLVGAISSAKEGVVSGPVAGSYGVYVFEVTGRETGAHFTEEDAKSYNDRLNAYAAQMILPVMMDDADVKDNRARFF